ncbi:hypothetical protein HDE68_002793 [Pedobacter cryoconitis]|uniref:Uncharacterized protein n=1 Tax=Pedobacter cryoconitis TaxID=188932 RepID=A0A7W9E0R3_9SPHI|nr:hypothetical protein [Pedobacter cryoconitis]MBB5636880.1 hypothetical protein [Pedobacter cryoconitis]
MSLQSLIFNTAPFALIPPAIMAVVLLRNSNITFRILSIHILISSVTEFSATLLWSLKINNIFLLHIYTLEEFALLSWFYATIITGSSWKIFFRGCLITFTILTLLNSLFLQPITVNNTYARGLESLLCMIYAIICFHKLINNTPAISKPYHNSLLLINSGVLIYFTSSCLLFTLSNYLRKPEFTDARMMLWTCHAFFSTVYYLLLFFGLWTIWKSKSYTSYSPVQ